MNFESGVYVLCSNSGGHILNDYSCYVSHGPFQGKQDVVSSGTLKQAKLFPAQEEAANCLERELPTWAKPKFRPVAVSDYHLMIAAPEAYAKLLREKEGFDAV